MKQNVEQFINYWTESKTGDRAGRIYAAYRAATAELTALKAKTTEYLVPLRTGKSIVCGFDPDRMGEVADLCNRIEQQKEAIENILADIDAFVSVAGSPVIGRLTSRVRLLDERARNAEASLREAVRVQGVVKPTLMPQEIVELPEIRALAKLHEETKAEAEKEKAALNIQIADATKILSKYR
jgi:hypothetical protein